MSRFLTIGALWVLVLGAAACASRQAGRNTTTPSRHRPFVYVSGYRAEILGFWLDPNSGALTMASNTSAGTAPSFLAWEQSGKYLFAIDEVAAGRVKSFATAPNGALNQLRDVSSAGPHPAHLSVDHSGRWVLVANYAGKPSGTVSVLPIGPEGQLGEPVETRDLGPGSRPHMITVDPTNHYVFVPCKGGGYVSQLRFDAATGKLTANSPDRITWPGARGPRHIQFHPKGRFAYVVDEQALTITVLAYDATSGRLSHRQTLSTLPPGVAAAPGYSAAAVVVHPEGKFLYAANRGHDSLAIYRLDKTSGRLTLVGHETHAIKHPRHFTIDPTGEFLLVANERTDNLTVFRVDRSSGLLSQLGDPVPVGRRPTFVGVIPLPE